MRLRDYISLDLTFVIADPKDKRSFLKVLVDRVGDRHPQLDRDELLRRLLAREEEVTTGIGHGVAIPHATTEGLEAVQCVIAQSPGGVDFEALDGSPVHITFLLLSPPGQTGTHIRLLARIARLADDEAFLYRIATAKDEEQLYALTVEEDRRHV